MISYLFNGVVNSISSSSNYGICNVNNIYNHMILTSEMLDDNDKKKYIESIKIQIGMSFYNDFKNYIFRKSPNHELLKYFT